MGEYLSSIAERKVELAVPQRGERRVLDPPRGEKTPSREIERERKQSERRHKSLELLQNVTGMAALPLPAGSLRHFQLRRTGYGRLDDRVCRGSAEKSDYRKFKIACAANGQDDYASMREMLTRRVQRYVDGDEVCAAAERVHDRRRSGSCARLQGGARLVRAVSSVLRYGQGRPPPYPRPRCAGRP